MGVTDEQIYSSLAPHLMRFATVLVGPNDAEDVVSSVVARALARRGGLAGLEDPKSYLTRSVLNEATGLKRARARRRTTPMALVPEPGSGSGIGTLAIREILDTLPSRQRAAAYLVFHQEHTAVEAAELLGIRPATVRRYIHLARQRIERALP